MSRYCVAATTPELNDLVDRALGGDDVVLTRDGNAVVALRLVEAGSEYPVGSHEWLYARTSARPKIGVTALELLEAVRAESDY